LRKGGLKLKLAGQPFQVLAILLERPGDVVTRDELRKRLWPDTFVDVDHNLNTAINKIREVLGDSAESPRFVETLARRGYRFVALMQGRACAPHGKGPTSSTRTATAADCWRANGSRTLAKKVLGPGPKWCSYHRGRRLFLLASAASDAT
jgi:DNA-binding winged helix-turn-helix (wHTH) protein